MSDLAGWNSGRTRRALTEATAAWADLLAISLLLRMSFSLYEVPCTALTAELTREYRLDVILDEKICLPSCWIFGIIKSGRLVDLIFLLSK